MEYAEKVFVSPVEPTRAVPNLETDLQRARQIAMLLDAQFNVAGIRFGMDAIVGLIPGVGDAGSAAVGAYLLRAAARLGVPTVVIARMLLNVLIDAAIGLIPIVGDYLDVLYKANAKNARLVIDAVENRTTTNRASWFKLLAMFAVFLTIVVGGLVGTVFVVKWVWNAV